ncbi:hypothetical protein U4959_04420 [Acinetobacter junii]|uniref:hypothetical protein n=1 Tax=Acinetobacter TaxID=469 RepID=UPI0024DE6E00|nr:MULTISPECIES: hypothetical protein [Acinetobacter]EJB8518482.1 hypothetical protein [Acinetobacter baumannii]WRL36011.1 hypothetical protein U4959_04420 [Acinetobacter junii]
MYIERLQIEEGFLNGLDVDLTSGLNVVIGARGTGKTSLIELIRFCLDVKGSIHENNKKSHEHALSILGSGQVTLTLSINGKKIIVSRTASDPFPRYNGEFDIPLIFSQTEIETIGLEATGRLRLIDSFLSSNVINETEEKKVLAIIGSLTVEISSLRKNIQELKDQLKNSVQIDEELNVALSEEQKVAQGSQIIQTNAALLQNLSNEISNIALNEDYLKRQQQEIYSWYNKIKEAFEYQINIIQNTTSPSIQSLTVKVNQVRELLKNAHDEIAISWHDLDKEIKNFSTFKLAKEAEARDLRVKIESLQEGAGLIMRRGQELREKKARYEIITSHLNNNENSLKDFLKKRDEEFSKLEQIRLKRFSERASIVNVLNNKLGPAIKLSINRNGQQNQFSALISDSLRGSNLKYNEIAPILSNCITPRMLLEAVENFDVELISDISGINSDRVARILNHLNNADLTTLGTIDIDDNISMSLLDGCQYKDITTLSTGQRCTVVLPIVLTHNEKVVIVDQPEDHIDNAFIAKTLIHAILSRDMRSQIIFSTHNPNIPVLGNADNVIHLDSDGKRGYVMAKGELNQEDIVDSISTVMEGGSQAFASRSKFYDQYPK